MPVIKDFEFELKENGCLVCTSHRWNTKRYPRLEFNGKNWSMARLIYTKCFGEVPNGLVIRHKCDNPHCINIIQLLLE